jgi:hypothetical protein
MWEVDGGGGRVSISLLGGRLGVEGDGYAGGPLYVLE